jgi:hypothetical protein
MRLAVALLAALPALGQTLCPGASAFSVCEISLAGVPREAEFKGEFRGPSHRTYLIPAFWNGSQMAFRVSPTEPGAWDYRFTDGREGQFNVAASESQGFIQPANVHHFSYSGSHQAHLWMGDTVPALDRAGFERFVEDRAAHRVNHLRFILLQGDELPDDAAWKDIDEKLILIHRKQMTTDLVLARTGGQFTRLLPDRAAREKFIRKLVNRYQALNITWAGFEEFESFEQSRELLKEIAGYLKAMDTYGHPISTGAAVTSSPLIDDGWMGYLSYSSSDGVIPAIEHQLYKAPAVAGFKTQTSFRQLLWNTSMTGAYPETTAPNAQAVQEMKVWFDIMAATRHWELEPYYDVTGGKCLALEGVEYVIYVERPGTVTIALDKKGYDAEWVNPANGQTTKIKIRNEKQDTYTFDTPDGSQDWVLHLAREGEKKSLARSYRFESRDVLLQEVELNPAKMPFDIVQPSADILSLKNPGNFSIKLKKDTRATRTMLFLWTGEVAADEQSFRVIGTGAEGTFQIPGNLARRFPASLHLRLTAMNAYGKIFVSERNVQLTK